MVARFRAYFGSMPTAIGVRECIFLGMQRFLPKFDLAFPNNV